MKTKNRRTGELAPCGIYCRACPSYAKTCYGCSSDKEQARKSKWSCKIRICCYSTKELDYCFDCVQFPCRIIEKKLIASHIGDARFRYRHELQESSIRFKELGLKKFLLFQRKRWECLDCGGIIRFYVYRCDRCGNEKFPENDFNKL